MQGPLEHLEYCAPAILCPWNTSPAGHQPVCCWAGANCPAMPPRHSAPGVLCLSGRYVPSEHRMYDAAQFHVPLPDILVCMVQLRILAFVGMAVATAAARWGFRPVPSHSALQVPPLAMLATTGATGTHLMSQPPTFSAVGA